MGNRRIARELALKILYQIELGEHTLESSLADFWENHIYPSEIRNFAETLVKGVRDKLKDIDKKISGYADNWDISRMPIIDRNIIRLAAYEIRYRDDIPYAVSINEALEIAKKYSTEESGSFINGVLDKIAKEKNDV
jgi:N utilization substance protein B